MYYFFYIGEKIEANNYLKGTLLLAHKDLEVLVDVCLVQGLLDEHKESDPLFVI